MIDAVGFQSQIPVIKSNLLGLLLNDSVLMRLVADRYDVELPAYELRYKRVYPWEYTMDATTDAGAFITLEMSLQSRRLEHSSPINPGTVDMSLYVYAFCHESIMRVDDAVAQRLELQDENLRGSRVDLMCARIDALLNGRELSSFGRFEFDDQQILNPISPHFHGKCNIYTSTSANRWGAQL